MTKESIVSSLLALAKEYPHKDDPIEMGCVVRKGDSLQISSDRLGHCVMVTADDANTAIDVCLSRKDAIAAAIMLLDHAGGLPE